MVNNVLSMDKDDVACFEKLRDLGVDLTSVRFQRF
ncbi:Protein-N(pi)-phosphohistidine--sugar phosphotransferase [Streptococcus thermophilus CNCM I-1630]|nr:Protein-N(pi)-phosphohistidine--sugar phosphotransferase [Streptococcus thermophilus CNCM I-1630]